MAKPDLKEFLAYSKPKRGHCPVAQVLEQLKDEDREALTAALQEEETITNVAIEKWLETRGHKVLWQSVSAHRRGVCRCA